MIADQAAPGQQESDINVQNRRNQADERAILRANWPRAAKMLPDGFKEMSEDGAPPYYARCSRQEMNEIFDEKWIGRGGPVAWLPRSPDLTSPDYFLWGFVKERVMAVAPTTPDDMNERIRQACTEITP